MSDAQMDLFSKMEPPARLSPAAATAGSEKAPEPDDLALRLVSAKYVGNPALLFLGASLGAHPDFDKYPSRLFGFPIEYVSGKRRVDGKETLLLRSDGLGDGEWLDPIEAETGVRPRWEPLDEFGRERNQGAFWHAIDLLNDEQFRAFLETRHLSTPGMVVNALRYARDFGGLSITNTRAVLAEYGFAEPADRSAKFFARNSIRVTNASSGQFVGFQTRGVETIWAGVHGLEAKRFKRDKNGYLRFAPSYLAELSAAS